MMEKSLITEIINGVELSLGEMSLAQLIQLEDICHHRVVEAQTDYMIVRDVRERRFLNGGPAA